MWKSNYILKEKVSCKAATAKIIQHYSTFSTHDNGAQEQIGESEVRRSGTQQDAVYEPVGQGVATFDESN